MMKLIAARRIPIKDCCDRDVLSLTNRLFCGWTIRDRFNILNKTSNWNFDTSFADKLPVALNDSISLTDLVDQRAVDLIEQAGDQNIAVSWSGGVDSTLVICALLKNGFPKQQLRILCTKPSISEYTQFYRWMVDQKIDIQIHEPLIPHLANVDCRFVVSGWCADQLFGSNIHLKTMKLYHKPWFDSLLAAFSQLQEINLSPKGKQLMEESWLNYAKHLGVQLEQWCDFAWLYNFGVKWSYVSNEPRLALAGTPNELKAVPFFDTYDFQCWSIRNWPTLKQRNVYKDKQYYKQELKQYIYDYTKDADYLYHKGKHNSWALVGEDLSSINVLTDQGVRIYTATNRQIQQYQYNYIGWKVGDLYRKKH